MFRFRIEGLDQLTRQINRLSDKAKALDGTHSVALKDMLTEGFLRRHTQGKCSSFDQWFAQSPFKVETQADFDGIPRDRWDSYVRSTTDFSTMEEMLQTAGAEYVQQRLFEP